MGVTIAEFAAHLGLVPDQESFERGAKLIEGIKTAVELLGLYEGVKVLGEMVEKTVDAAVGFKRLSQETGVSVEAIQEFGYAAKLSGADTETMQVAFRHLATGMEQVRRFGSGPLADALQQLGIHFSAIKGKSPDKVMEIIADHLAKLPDGFRKTAIASDIFGERSGSRLIPLMNRGAAGMAELRREAEATGGVMGDDAVEGAEKAEEAFAHFHMVVDGLKNRAVLALLPALERVAYWLSDVIPAAVEYAKDAFSAVATFVEDHSDAITAGLVAIGGAILVTVIPAILAMVTTIVTTAPLVAAGLALAWGPLLLVIGVVAAVIYAIKKLAEFVVGHALTWRQMWSSVVDGAKKVVSFIGSIPGRVVQFFVDMGRGIKQAFLDAYEWVIRKAEELEHKLTHSTLGKILTGLTGTTNAFNAYEQSKGTTATSPGLTVATPSPASGGNRTTIYMGDTHIEVHAKTDADPDDIARVAGDVFDDKHQEALRRTSAAFGGGA